MLKVRLKETYPNQFWNSGNGVTIAKEDRIGVLVDEDNIIINNAFKSGILEVVEEPAEELKIIRDEPSKETIKEIVNEENSKELQERLKKVREKSTMKPAVVDMGGEGSVSGKSKNKKD